MDSGATSSVGFLSPTGRGWGRGGFALSMTVTPHPTPLPTGEEADYPSRNSVPQCYGSDKIVRRKSSRGMVMRKNPDVSRRRVLRWGGVASLVLAAPNVITSARAQNLQKITVAV